MEEGWIAAAALRGVLAEVEGNPALAAVVLARLLGPVNANRPHTSDCRSTESTTPSVGAAEPTEASRLVRELAARLGSFSAVAVRFGFSGTTVARYRDGGACTPGNLGRLRQAVAELERQGREADEEPVEVAAIEGDFRPE